MSGLDLTVLGSGQAAETAAASEAAQLLGAAAAVLVVRLSDDSLGPIRWRVTPFRGASRAAQQLRDQGFVASAQGRLVIADCSGESAAGDAERLIDQSLLPVVLACMRVRDDQLDRLIFSSRQVALVASQESAIDELALAQLEAAGCPAKLIERPSAAAAWFASFGFALPSFGSSSGQATVELIAGAPILLAVTLAAAQLLAAGLCREQAASAAGAGASALLQDRDPLASARRAVPGWSRGRLTVKRRGRVMTVSIKPPTLIPGLSSLLSVTAHADAGPVA